MHYIIQALEAKYNTDTEKYVSIRKTLDLLHKEKDHQMQHILLDCIEARLEDIHEHDDGRSDQAARRHKIEQEADVLVRGKCC